MKTTISIIKKSIIALAIASPLAIVLCSLSSVYASPVNNEIKEVTYRDEKMYYSDDYFINPSTTYNPHLSTLSMHMANFSSPDGEIKKEYTEEQKQNWYKNQPNKIKGFFDTIGFTNFDSNEDYKIKTTFNTIGIGAASKKLADGTTVIGVVPRSGGYYNEWGNNVWLGTGSNSDYMHEGWYNAANKLINFLDYYIENKGITGDVKLWITGFSRGGATANIAAGLLDNKISNNEQVFKNVNLKKENVYAYTFEAPQGANINSKTVKAPKDPIYNNIWNIINPNDLVPKLAMSQWGFTRFGTDKYITTKFYDAANYDNNERVFKQLYIANKNDWTKYNAENFKIYGTPVEQIVKAIVSYTVPGGTKLIDNSIVIEDKTKANYDPNITETLFLEELTKNVGSRDNYCKNYQDGISKLLTYFMEGDKQLLSDKISDTIQDGLQAVMYGALSYVVLPIGKAKEMTNQMMSKITGNPALFGGIELLVPLIKAVAATYWEKPNELISIIKQSGNIFENHDTAVIIPHLQAQDSYYVDAYNLKELNKPEEERNIINLVPLMDNADFGRASFDCYNDVKLYTDYNKNGTQVVDVKGCLCDKSKVIKCDPGYAVGYYSYMTEEKMELFFPANRKYSMEIKDYSKKIRHTIEYWTYYQFMSIDNHNLVKKQLSHNSRKVWFNSDTYTVNMNVVA